MTSPLDDKRDSHAPTLDAWFVARTKPNGEFRARKNLERQGFTTFIPQEERQQKRGRRQVIVFRPVFPSYIFVAIDLRVPRWTSVNSTFGVTRLVPGADGQPARMPKGAIDSLLRRTDEEGRLLPPEAVEIGSDMRIVRGPFANWVAEVIAAPDDKRVQLLFDLMGRKVAVTTTRDNLAKP
jgi:transcriptional antiterminator RfaH